MRQIKFLPTGIHFDNYIKILKIDNLATVGMVSLFRVLLGTFLSLLCTSYLAYFFTKRNMWKRKIWYRMIVITMYFSAGLIPGYMNMKLLGLLDSFWVYVIPGAISAYNLVLVKTFIESLPDSLEEAAYIDGAGYLQRYVRIIIPLSKPILATIGLFSAVGHWNDFFSTKLYITSPKLYTLQFVLYEYLSRTSAIEAVTSMEDLQALDAATRANTVSISMTRTFFVIMPIICVYPLIQRYYVKGIMVGAIKG